MGVFVPAEENVKVIGRTYLRNDIRWCAFSGTGIEFVSRGKKVVVTLYGDSTISDIENQARYVIFVDGQRKIDEMLSEKVRKVVIADDDKETVHVVRLIKVSESAMSTMGIGVVETESILPTQSNEIFIEYIGDSITCGYGVDDENPENHFHTYTEDVTKAFSYVSAQKLCVDYSMVSFSGYGVISGYTESGAINSIELLPPHYKKLGFSYAESGEEGAAFKVADIPWDFSGRKPEFVVINLGTNDTSYAGEDKAKQLEYQEKYIELIKIVRQQYPDCYILSILGLMGDLLYPALVEAVNKYKIETGDVMIETMPIQPIIAETEGYVADYHPTRISHERAADLVADRISQIAFREFGITMGIKEAALTFDDGPNTKTTVKVLDVLEKNHIPATFFLVGNDVNAGSAASVRRAVSLGCEIENHSMTHSCMPDMTEEEFMAEIEENNEIINRLTGLYPTFFRPPFLAVNDAMRKAIPMTMIGGYGCEDWLDEISANKRAQKQLSQLKHGAILLMHDSINNDKTVEALKIIVNIAKNLGITFVRLDELFDNKHISPERGVVYNEAVLVK